MNAFCVLVPSMILAITSGMVAAIVCTDDIVPKKVKYISSIICLLGLIGLGWVIYSGTMEYRVLNILYVQPQGNTLPGGNRIYTLSFYDDRGNIIIHRLDYLPPENSKVKVSIFDTQCSYAGLYWERAEKGYRVEKNVTGEKDGRIN